MPATDSSYVQLFNVQWPWYHFGEENWILFLFHQACKFVYCMQYSLHSYGYLFIQNDIGTKKICSNCVPTWHEVKRRTTQPDPCLLNKCILWKHPRSTKNIQLYRHKWGKRKSPMCQQNDNYIQFTYVHLMKSKKLHIQWRKLLTLLSIYIYMCIVCILHFQVDQEKHSNSMCHIASNLKRRNPASTPRTFLKILMIRCGIYI